MKTNEQRATARAVAKADLEQKQRAAAAAEQKRRADCYDDLLGALKECAAVCAGETSSKSGLVHALERARSAMQKAAGVAA